jgi:hypothetical protein
MGWYGLDWSGLGQGSVKGSCECGNEMLGNSWVAERLRSDNFCAVGTPIECQCGDFRTSNAHVLQCIIIYTCAFTVTNDGAYIVLPQLATCVCIYTTLTFAHVYSAIPFIRVDNSIYVGVRISITLTLILSRSSSNRNRVSVVAEAVVVVVVVVVVTEYL